MLDKRQSDCPLIVIPPKWKGNTDDRALLTAILNEMEKHVDDHINKSPPSPGGDYEQLGAEIKGMLVAVPFTIGVYGEYCDGPGEETSIPSSAKDIAAVAIKNCAAQSFRRPAKSTSCTLSCVMRLISRVRSFLGKFLRVRLRLRFQKEQLRKRRMQQRFFQKSHLLLRPQKLPMFIKRRHVRWTRHGGKLVVMLLLLLILPLVEAQKNLLHHGNQQDAVVEAAKNIATLESCPIHLIHKPRTPS